MDDIQSFGKQTPILAEYDYVAGGVLVRVSKQLTPTQAKEYETALAAIVGQPATERLARGAPPAPCPRARSSRTRS